MLKKLKIKNFKSFKDFEIELDKFNCIIAPNNAGKSNLIYVLNFLQYATIDVKYAIEEFGGFDNIKNIFLENDSIEFDIVFFKEKLISEGIRSYIDKSLKQEKKQIITEEFIEVFKNLEITLKLTIFQNGNWEKRYNIKGNFWI